MAATPQAAISAQPAAVMHQRDNDIEEEEAYSQFEWDTKRAVALSLDGSGDDHYMRVGEEHLVIQAMEQTTAEATATRTEEERLERLRQ